MPIDQILAADRMTTWNPGVGGGVPNRDTIYTTLHAEVYTGTNASSAIQAALESCPINQVVQLSEGVFNIDDLLLIHTPITLRGMGAGKTFLVKTNGAQPRINPTTPKDPGTYSYEAEPVVIIGPQRWNVFDNTTSKNLTADGAKGALAITVSDGSGFAAGQFVMLDELSGASWQATPTGFPDNAQVWRGDRVAYNMHLPQQQYQDDCQFSDAEGPYQDTGDGRKTPDSMSWFSRTDRPTNEIKEIAVVAGNVIVFTTPLHISYRTSHTAQLTKSTGANVFIRDAGVEDLTTQGGADGQVRFTHAAHCWARNVEVTQWIGEGVAVDSCFKITVRDGYIHDGSWPVPGGGGYAISLAYGSSEVLIENNIITNTNKVMVFRSSGSGSVVGYNYTDDAWIYGTPGWQEVGINASHMNGPHHVLFEGNYATNADSDYTHGNAIYLTFFRNWLSGYRKSFTDTDNKRCVGLGYGSWFDSFVGNVLGIKDQMGNFNYEAAAMSGNNSTWLGPNVYQIGYDPERWNSYADPDTLSTLIRDGNWDFKTNSQIFHNGVVSYIPSSLYLTSKPAFFGTFNWPWVMPADGTTGTLPAKARFESGNPNNHVIAKSYTLQLWIDGVNSATLTNRMI